MNLNEIPEWLGTGLIAGVSGILGYLGKSLHDYWKTRRSGRSTLIVKLKELSALLEESRSLFAAQNEQARRLVKMLEESHPDQFDEDAGFEEIFSELYDNFTPEESKLHAIIRSITVSPQQRVNQSMSDWLKGDLFFKSPIQRTKARQELAEQLRVLELHLNMWHAKYNTWIPDNPKHTLVYLADEEKHGVGFPTHIEEIVDSVLRELE